MEEGRIERWQGGREEGGRKEVSSESRRYTVSGLTQAGSELSSKVISLSYSLKNQITKEHDLHNSLI